MGSARSEAARRSVAPSPVGSALPLEFTRHPLTHADPDTLSTLPGAADDSTGATGRRPLAPSYSPNPTPFPTAGCGALPTGAAAASAPRIPRCRGSDDGQEPSRAGTHPCTLELARAAGRCTSAADGTAASLPAKKSATAGRGGCGAGRAGCCGGGLGRRCEVRLHPGPSATQPPWHPCMAPQPESQQPLQPQQQLVASRAVPWRRLECPAGSREHASSVSSAPATCPAASACEAEPECLPPYGTSTCRRPRRQGTPGCDAGQRRQQQPGALQQQQQQEQQQEEEEKEQEELTGLLGLAPTGNAVAATLPPVAVPVARSSSCRRTGGICSEAAGSWAEVEGPAAYDPPAWRRSTTMMTPPPSSAVKSSSGRGCSGRGSCGRGSCHGGRRCGGGSPRRPPPLLLSLLLVATLQGLMVSGPCTAAAEWSWIMAKSRAASGAIGAAAAAAATPATPGGWSFSGMLPYGWREHGGGGAATTSESSGSSSSAANSKSRGGSSSSSASTSRKTRGAGAGMAGVGGSGGGVTFSAGVVDVAVNPAGNVTALLEYDPYIPPPPSPSPPAPKGSRRSKTVRREGPRAHLLSDAQLALRELLTAPSSKRPPYDLMKPYKLPAASYKTSDFVFATGSFPARYILAQSTRSWRRGIRAFVAVNNTEDLPLLNERNRVHNEHYSYFPDDGTGDLGPVYHGYMAGDTRAAMAPFLAHEYFGETYKWMLYGDDDTVFYMPAVKRLLAHLDPELPFAISDNLWFRARHPNLFGPRCLPCHMAVDADPEPPTPAEAAEAAAAGSHHEASKPLRIPNITSVMDGYQRFLLGVRSASDLDSAKVQKLLSKNTFGDFNKSLAAIAHLPPDASVPGVRYLPRPACPFCTAEAACNPTPPPAVNVSGAGCFASGGHGGAGMIFSVGLIRRLSPGRMKACYMKILKAPGGDGMLSACVWEAGYAFTDPGASTLARYDGNYLFFSSEAGKWALHDPLTLLLRGKCDGRCKWLLRNAASHHGRGRHFQNFEQSAAYLYGNMASYTATHKWLAFMAGRDGDLAELAAAAADGGE